MVICLTQLTVGSTGEAISKLHQRRALHGIHAPAEELQEVPISLAFVTEPDGTHHQLDTDLIDDILISYTAAPNG